MGAGDLVKQFYRLRERRDPDALRPLLAGDVRWREPEVGNHMGELAGAEAVIDMLRRALVDTGGTFSLRIAERMEVAGHRAAVIVWSAQRGQSVVEDRELATFSVKDGQITFAQFLPENIADDRAFWGEA
jgi:ketosteroid isomerase-like protein